MFPLALLFISWCAGALTEASQYYDLDDAHIHFNEFMTKFGKNYVSEHEMRHRFEIFKANLQEVNRLNQEENVNVYGISRFMDVTKEEFVNTYTGFRAMNYGDHCVRKYDEDIPNTNVPDSFDWREKNAVAKVDNQGECGCCWAFSAAGVLEGQYAIRHKGPVSLSKQQMIDCDLLSEGCCGGTPGNAIKSVIEQGGILRERDYPFIGRKLNCTIEKPIVAAVKSCTLWRIESQEKIKRLLYTYGPISIAIRGEGIIHYDHGIIPKCNNNTFALNHAVLLVGYGAENGQQYWTVKNSWGNFWGNSGYFRLPRGEGIDSCGMQVDFLTTAELE
ncbi:unnamed protein product [Arctia plantaginis]|uniref:Uncharacterized protein n=1 Tax=Arctia plantaginis TaxID=874455 RepID=A0A8S0ZDA6_ARCPL|nr:unnamed protein product [Arctia plantaginis]